MTLSRNPMIGACGRHVAIAALLFTLYGLSGTGDASAQALPEKAAWENNMQTYGTQHGQMLMSSDPSITFDQKLAAVYYDGPQVYQQIAAYTGDAHYYAYADAAIDIYRNQYVIPNSGKVPGYWNFTTGLRMHAQRTGDERSRQAVFLLANNAAYAPDSTPLEWTQDSTLSREVAYTIEAYLNAEALGAPHRARMNDLVSQALGHIDQWFVSRSAPYVRPFMVALTAHALKEYNEKYPDARVVPALIDAADKMWAMWLPDSESFQYTDRQTNEGGTEPAPDLNLLIAPMYSYLYKQTGATRFRDRASAIFQGGVKYAWLGNGKQFCQNYRWSFEVVKDLGQNQPINVGLTQDSDTSPAGVPHTIHAVYSDLDGADNLSGVYLYVGTGGDQAIWCRYDVGSNRLFMLSDPHDAWLGGFSPGSAGAIITTDEGKLDCGATWVERSGNTVTVHWVIIPPACKANTHQNISLYCEDITQLYNGWTLFGTWYITSAP